MNKTSIGYVDFTWNPYIGCLHNCQGIDCWAKAQAKRRKWECEMCYHFLPHFHLDRLFQPRRRKKSARIAVSFMGDLFGEWVPETWIRQIIFEAEICQQHTFIFLTKNPSRYEEFEFPLNCWLGTSMSLASWSPGLSYQVEHCLPENSNVKWLSLEPLIGPLYPELNWIDLVVMGPQTKGKEIVYQPPKEYIDKLLKHIDEKGILVFMKDKLDYQPKRQELPY